MCIRDSFIYCTLGGPENMHFCRADLASTLIFFLGTPNTIYQKFVLHDLITKWQCEAIPHYINKFYKSDSSSVKNKDIQKNSIDLSPLYILEIFFSLPFFEFQTLNFPVLLVWPQNFVRFSHIRQ